MKKLGLGILVAAMALTLSGLAVAISDQAADVAKEKAKTPDLEKVEFIHWKKGFVKPPCNNNEICEPELGENPSCVDCKEREGESAPTTCYAFLGKYGKKLLEWRNLPVSYVINPGEFAETFVAEAISAGAEKWDGNTFEDLFNDNYTVSTGSETTYRVQNYVNAISFDDYYLNPDIIGAATVWYNPATKEIVEFDIVFETNYAWGDCIGSEATCKSNGVMDLQSIATHEIGHGVGLADVYEIECSEVTMYGYSGYGETQKRTLETPDATGIQALYGGF